MIAVVCDKSGPGEALPFQSGATSFDSVDGSFYEARSQTILPLR